MEAVITIAGAEAFVKECFARGLEPEDATALLNRYLADYREVERDD